MELLTIGEGKRQMSLPWTVLLIFLMTAAYAYHCETGDKFTVFVLYFWAVCGCGGMWAMDSRNWYYAEYLKRKEDSVNGTKSEK